MSVASGDKSVASQAQANPATYAVTARGWLTSGSVCRAKPVTGEAGIGLDFVRPHDHSPPNFDAEGALWRKKRCSNFRGW